MNKAAVFLIIFLFAPFIFTQEGTGKANVELPDFVITGKDQVTLPPAKKIKPGIISTLSEEFINPPYSPDEFSTGDISNPEKIITIKKDSQYVYTGYVNAGFGNISIPSLEAGITFKGNHFLASPRLRLQSVRDYEESLGYRTADFTLHTVYTSPAESGFFSDISTGLNARYFSDSRKLFTDPVLPLNRNLNVFNTGMFVRRSGFTGPEIEAGARFSVSKIGEFDFNDNSTELYTALKHNAGNFGIFGNFSYFSDNYLNRSFNSYSALGGVEFSVPGKFSLSLETGYTDLAGESGLVTAGEFNVKMGSGLSLSLGYHNRLVREKRDRLLILNSFSVPDSNLFLVQKEINNLRLSTKYEFKQYFEVSLFVQVGEIRNFNYFQRDTLTGVFQNKATDIDRLKIGADTKFHSGPLGYFYGNITLSSLQDSLENDIPYIPVISLRGLYGYNFPMNISVEVGAEFYSGILQSLGSSSRTDAYINLSALLKYKLAGTLSDLSIYIASENLLNQRIDYWQGYVQPPLDITAGVEWKF